MSATTPERRPDPPASPSVPAYNPNYNPATPLQQEFEEYDLDNPNGSSQNKPNNSQRPPSTKREVGGAAVAAGIAGLVVAGPILGLAAGGGAAYVATTQSNSVGSATRRGGEAVASAGDKVVQADKNVEYPINPNKWPKVQFTRPRRWTRSTKL